MILILDIDGTLADISHREHFIAEEPKDWDSFFDEDLVVVDEPLEVAQEGLLKIIDKASEIYFITGRPERLRSITTNWLAHNFGIAPTTDMLLMREEGDTRPSDQFKKEVLLDKFDDEDDLVFIDDEEKNIKMFSNYGEAFLAPDFWEDLIEEI